MSGAERLARAVELRTDFDAAFARTPDPATPPQLDLLVIGVGSVTRPPARHAGWPTCEPRGRWQWHSSCSSSICGSRSPT